MSEKIKPKSKAIWIVGFMIFLLLAGYFLNRFFIERNVHAVDTTKIASRSIAVLPFVNLSGDSTQEYFSDGMTESIITDLAQIPGLLVIARNSVFQYKGKVVNTNEVGKQLNVRYILQGKVQHAGDDLRINAQLIETQKGIEVWAQKFDSKLKNVFSVQDSISNHIIQELKIAIEQEDSLSKPPPTQNLEAYDYYLRGYYLSRKNAAAGRASIDSAITMFGKAISLDPKFALAYSALGKACTAIFFIYDSDSKWESKAYINIEKALRLDPKLADAYVAKGNLTWTLANGFPHEKAIKELKHSITLNQNNVEAHESLGSIYFHIGMFEEALREFRIALTLDPAGKFTRPRIARIYWYQQKFDSALNEFSALPPSGWLREQAMVLWSLGKTDEAFNALEKMKKVVNMANQEEDLAAAYAVLYAGIGKKKEAEMNIKLAIEHGEGISHFHHAEHLIASAYALMRNANSAVEWLQKAADHGLPCYPLFKNDPNLKNIRNDPGYISLMEKMKKQWEYFKSSL